MYYLQKDEELTYDKITQIIQKFCTNELPKLQIYENYYLGKQKIMNKVVADESKPCNRIVTNYCNCIVNNYLGYIAGVDISYVSSTDISAVQEVLNYNDVRNADSELLRKALIYGRAFEINYLDEEARQRFKILDTKECIPVYDNTLNQELLFVIRFYEVDNLDITKGYYIEVYTPTEIMRFKSNQTYTGLEAMETIPHYFGQVPITVFALNAEQESIFDKIMSLQDAYNTLLSSEIDDFEAFCDAYLVLKNCYMDSEDVAEMREKRTLILAGENTDAAFLNKNISDTQIENMLANIDAQIHKVANSPNFSDASFGTSSGIALRYRLLGFENTAAGIVANMTKALQHRIELICAILELTATDTTWRDVEIKFTRNLPVDYADLVNTINQLRGIVSDKTLISLLPFVKDADAELENLQGDNAFLASLYNFQKKEEVNE